MGIVREILTEMGPGEEAGFHLSRDLKKLRGWGTPKIVSAPICTPLLWSPLRINPLSSNRCLWVGQLQEPVGGQSAGSRPL